MEKAILPQDERLFLISSREFRYKLKTYLSKIGVNTSSISMHSFRKGGAHAASIAKVPDSVIQAHGRWQSMCFTRYTAVEIAEAGTQGIFLFYSILESYL